jgi:small subunit ribosomal protein S21
MIIVPIKEGDNVERALKKFKRKFEKTGVIRELRERQAYKKPSVKKEKFTKRLFTFNSYSRNLTRLKIYSKNIVFYRVISYF